MSTRILDAIMCPADIKGLDAAQLDTLAEEIREQLIETTSVTGGHLASSLGAVEIILAIHRVLDCPKDRIVFDVGHQAYAHKLLTGRVEQFKTLRMYQGLSGFPKREESIYDTHDSGHASDSLSTALGLAVARDLDGGDEKIVALVGDGSISSGLSFEALNQMGQLKTKVIIVLNDNEMSIAKNVGALAIHLARARMSSGYQSKSQRLVDLMSSKGGRVTNTLLRAGLAFKRAVKQFFVPVMLFEDLGIKYLGPIDGHDIEKMELALTSAKEATGPVLIHVLTKKGRGYEPAYKHPDVFHGIGPFNKETGEALHESGGAPSYTKVFSTALCKEAASCEKLVAITAAMSDGTGLKAFQREFPQRFFDVGIAEEHAVTFASGLAIGGKIPVVAIYSTFLQRAFDEIVINVAMQNQHVIFCIDRAGLVGADGPTHHGALDIAYLRLVPNMCIMAPSNEAELVEAFHTALALEGPVAVRYPRGNGIGIALPEEPCVWEVAKGITRRQGTDIAILALGRMVNYALDAAQILEQQGYSVRVVDMRWAKPIDEQAVIDASSCKLVVTVEEGTVKGGFGDGVLEILSRERSQAPTLVLGIPDYFVGAGDLENLLDDIELSAAFLARRITAALIDADSCDE